jgi:hypothetical protein
MQCDNLNVVFNLAYLLPTLQQTMLPWVVSDYFHQYIETHLISLY